MESSTLTMSQRLKNLEAWAEKMEKERKEEQCWLETVLQELDVRESDKIL